MDDQHFAPAARELLKQNYSIEKGIYHYRSWALRTYKTHLSSETVILKKYFYALRPLLAVKWLKTYQTIPPVEFEKLRTLIKGSKINQIIDDLLQCKKQSLEKELIAPIPELNQFIQQELIHLANYKGNSTIMEGDSVIFNQLFQKILDHNSA